MDPDATLREIQEIVAAYSAGVIVGDDARADLLDEMVSHVAQLDQWLTRGGFLPTSWARVDGGCGHCDPQGDAESV